jgi:hypothetical protein
MKMDIRKIIDFRQSIIKPVLNQMGASNIAAEELLLGTAIQESLFLKYRVQMGGGPALSYYQIEPATHNDIWDNYLRYRSELAAKAIAFLSSPDADKSAELEANDKYATAMARIHYMRVPAKLPDAGDVKAQANYWKQYYNTPLGKGKPREFIEKWEQYLEESNI